MPSIINSCNTDTVWLRPVPESPAIKAKWADGYPSQDRKVTQDGTYIWNVWYSAGACHRSDTVKVHLQKWKGLALHDVNSCDSANTYLQIDSLPGNTIVKWDNGEGKTIRKINMSGTYTAHVIDTISKCSRDISARAIILQSNPPVWNGKDTEICKGDIITLSIPKDYEIRSSSGQAITDLRLSDEGYYYYSYRLISNPIGICNWETASYHIKHYPVDAVECPQLQQCNWQFPDAFSPDGDGLNDTWFPVCSCTGANYEVSIYNRWGQRVFSGKNKVWNGEGMMEGVYLYTVKGIDAAHRESYQTGTITLIRH